MAALYAHANRPLTSVLHAIRPVAGCNEHALSREARLNDPVHRLTRTGGRLHAREIGEFWNFDEAVE